MTHPNEYSKARGYIKRFNHDVEAAQLPFYVARIRDIVKTVAGFEAARKWYEGRRASVNFPFPGKPPKKWMSNNEDFTRNAFSIYGPARLRRALFP